MFIDTHCHINMMVKKNFDVIMNQEELQQAVLIAKAAHDKGISSIINVGTSLIESQNCITIAKACPSVFATVGIHPNDLTESWWQEIKELEKFLHNTQNKIVGIGEVGLDFHYPDYNISRQKDAFKMQIELALEHNLALVVHTRDARDETLRSLEEFKGQIARGIIHCFSEDFEFAKIVIDWGFAIGIGGTLTYPKNEELRKIVSTVSLDSIVLETDAPYLPIQAMRGKQNHPQYIVDIATYIAELRKEPLSLIASKTTQRAQKIFNLLP